MGALVLAEGGTFVPPGADSFVLPPIFGGVTKPMVLVVLSALIVGAYFVIATRNLKLVPGKGQFVAESIYDFSRNSIARQQIGAKDFRPFVPLIFALFTFILVNNIYGIIPLIQFPTMSRIGFPIALFIVAYLVIHAVGFKRHGFLGYLKHVMFPPGVPKPIYILLSPIEFFQKFIAQPVALAIRVFAAMFAGHLILLVFTIGGQFLLMEASAALKPVSVVAFAFAIALTFVEALIQVLQAYIFALLVANFIGAAMAQEH
ncbi:ATP synthase F0 subcomplex A subunit [Saccharopolyspora erythraea NRRL 2338]|uniref:ATP synthase subunit a n=2 Tax=Saccharopolyspora erythraea TaxID=1836 RepID=A4FN33_SACEN|nr:F0F1 ATP synthase subunit A [Saccharopolyspora erythraea]EQD81718.1 ATP synthase subunit A [Saccharopolyspora erythraea D]PFG99099.1 ATP synthase F0 subcomplex A subunit [Saccharopolyspora erythraea NRRL 2338]QRK89059.1 F0F1 ATP synthase subunit A [Saccharopolyspora erythraea]CAM05458.1 ATP synthase A chain [Saccharopolyspora erythraea NRRL 2338]